MSDDATDTAVEQRGRATLRRIESALRGEPIPGRGPRRRAIAGLTVLTGLVLYGGLGPTTSLHRALIVAGALAILASVIVMLKPGVLDDFVFGSGPAVNLAVVRIVVFSVLLTTKPVAEALVFSRFPDELVVPLPGLGLLDPLVTNESLVVGVTVLFAVMTSLTVIGWFTRRAAAASLVLGFFVLGVPQFFGKVNHYHHLLWIAAILAVSRCGDALSVDAFRAASRRGADGVTDPGGPERAYALPLRFVWLLLGVIYLFPGFWKFVIIGPEWALGDNLRLQMLRKWMELGSWEPLFRVDQYPLLYRTAGVVTLLFEISFIVLLLSPVLRPLLAVSGLAFHNSTAAFMNIRFASLQAMYVSLVDWERVFRAVGRRVFDVQLKVVHDPRDPAQGRVVALLRAFDVFGGLSFEAGDDPWPVRRHREGAIATGQYEAFSLTGPDETARTGRSALLRALRRVPFLWPAAPWLLGWVSDDHPRREPKGSRSDVASRAHGTLGVLVVGVTLVLITLGAGLSRVHNAWPFSVYPTFAYIAPSEVSELHVVLHDSTGARQVLGRSELEPVMSPERLTPILRQILDAEDAETAERVTFALLEVMEMRGFDLDDTDQVTIRRVLLATDPDLAHLNPITDEPLLTVDVGDRWPRT